MMTCMKLNTISQKVQEGTLCMAEEIAAADVGISCCTSTC